MLGGTERRHRFGVPYRTGVRSLSLNNHTDGPAWLLFFKEGAEA
jgi:hypothetical protein